MITIFLYIARVILCSAILYGYYLLALRNNKFHQWNRYYLLLAVILSITIPLLPLPFGFNFNAPVSSSSAFFVANSAAVTIHAASSKSNDWLNWNNILLVIYLAASTALLLRFIYSLVKLKWIIRKGTKVSIDKYVLIETTDENTPFSFFNYIFYNNLIDLQTPQGKKIWLHELAHVKQKHTLDKLFLELVWVIFWFNPIFYFIKQEMSIIHEFIADSKASEGEKDQLYQELLVCQALNISQLNFVNSFFHHKIKRRLYMITLSKQPRFSYVRRILVLPLALLVLSAFAVGKKNNTHTIKYSTQAKNAAYFKQEKQAAKTKSSILPVLTNKPKYGGNTAYSKQKKQVAKIKGSEIPAIADNSNYNDTLPPPPPPSPSSKSQNVVANPVSNKNLNGKPVFQFVEQMPRFQGAKTEKESYEKILQFLHNHIKYPSVARDNRISGIVTVSFVITNKGAMEDIRTLGRQLGGGLDEEALRVVKLMPDWIPGKQNGKNVNVQYTLPVRFVLQDDNGSAQTISKVLSPVFVTGYSTNSRSKNNQELSRMPLFPGAKNEEQSQKKIIEFLHKNIIYPAAAKKQHLMGMVEVSFTIKSSGDITNIQTNSLFKTVLDTEAIRVIKLMPRWQPGLSDNNQPVNVKYSLPIDFSLK